MIYSSFRSWAIGLLLLIAVLGILRFKPWRLFMDAESLRSRLEVGFLPVT